LKKRGGFEMNAEQFVEILGERIKAGDAFDNYGRPGTVFTVDSVSNSAVMFKLGGQTIKLSVANCVDIFNCNSPKSFYHQR
jgi:hypothetical protein